MKFEYHAEAPEKALYLNTKLIKNKKSEGKPRINLALLKNYGLYRDTVYKKYAENDKCAQDIKNFKPIFEDKSAVANDDPIYHYAMNASIGSMQEWKDKQENMQSYIAKEFDSLTGKYKDIGFVHFQEKTLNDKPGIYVAQMGVAEPGKGLGYKLMQCVLTHFPAETEFHILTRVFNDAATQLYNRKLGFEIIDDQDIIEKLGYDSRYVYFNNRFTANQLEEMVENMEITMPTLTQPTEDREMKPVFNMK